MSKRGAALKKYLANETPEMAIERHRKALRNPRTPNQFREYHRKEIERLEKVKK